MQLHNLNVSKCLIQFSVAKLIASATFNPILNTEWYAPGNVSKNSPAF